MADAIGGFFYLAYWLHLGGGLIWPQTFTEGGSVYGITYTAVTGWEELHPPHTSARGGRRRAILALILGTFLLLLGGPGPQFVQGTARGRTLLNLLPPAAFVVWVVDTLLAHFNYGALIAGHLVSSPADPALFLLTFSELLPRRPTVVYWE